MKRLIPFLAIALVTSACATHKIHYRNPSVASNGAPRSAKQSFYLWGLAGGSEVDLQQMCPGGVAAIESKTGVGDRIFSILTFGLYSPMSVDVSCGGAGVATGDAR
ncbi:MAG: hypothetical protein SFX73_34845 [Kofleriaceae bacterium]|nr:hypothetical protein [Kofleriaceae bacterium]